jgi:hypothetical protein
MEMIFWTSVVIRWQPLEGAVMDISCWNYFGGVLLIVSFCCEDWQMVVVRSGKKPWDVWAKEEGTAGTTKQVTKDRAGRRNPR